MHTPEEMEIKMLKKIYRAIVLAQTASAAVKVVARMTDAQLSDIGIIRSQFPVVAMNIVEAEFARKDIESLEKRNSGESSSLSAATLLNHAFLQTSRT
jgi:uncharacterized protein YjiS (DUF1127 family)